MVNIHASQAFVKRFKCDVSLADQRVAQPGRLDAWSAHVVRVARSPLVVLMNDASLYTLLVPGTGLTAFPDFVRILLGEIGTVWIRHGARFDPDAHPVVVMRRTNRSLIGSMNDAVHMIKWHHEMSREGGRPFDLAEIQHLLNRTPYKAIDHDCPRNRIGRLLRGDGLTGP